MTPAALILTLAVLAVISALVVVSLGQKDGFAQDERDGQAGEARRHG